VYSVVMDQELAAKVVRKWARYEAFQKAGSLTLQDILKHCPSDWNPAWVAQQVELAGWPLKAA
jgi:hypothetical protein